MIGFTLGLSSVSFLITQAVLDTVFSHGVALMSNQTLVVYPYKLYATIVLAYLAGRTLLQIKGSVAGLVFTFLLWCHGEYLPVPKILTYRSKGSMYELAQLLHVLCIA